MKKLNIYLLLAAFGFAFVMTGCGGTPDTPEAVVKAFDKAMKDKDWGKAKDLSTEKTHKMIDMMKGMAEKAPKSDEKAGDLEKVECETEKIEAAEGEKEGESSADAQLAKATEKADCTACCDKDGKEKNYKLLKVDGKWKVHMSKSDK